jgi:hypothetical protein
MNISRRDALLGATAAAAVTGLTVAPLAMKAAGVKAALAGDPVLPAYEAFEAARLESIAMSDHRLAVVEAVEAELPPEPHRNRTYLDRDFPDSTPNWPESVAHSPAMRVRSAFRGIPDLPWTCPELRLLAKSRHSHDGSISKIWPSDGWRENAVSSDRN